MRLLFPASRRGIDDKAPTETDTGAADGATTEASDGSDPFGLDDFHAAGAPTDRVIVAGSADADPMRVSVGSSFVKCPQCDENVASTVLSHHMGAECSGKVVVGKSKPKARAKPKTKTKRPENARSLETLSSRFGDEMKGISQNYLDDFQRYCDCVHELWDGEGALTDLDVDYWWTGSGRSGVEGAEANCLATDSEGRTVRLMPPFGIKIVEDLFIPWLLKWYNRANLTQYEYAINAVFAREDRRFVKGGSGNPPWIGSDFDLLNTRYSSLRATLNDEDGVEANVGGANKLKEGVVTHLLGKAEEQWGVLQGVALNQVTEQKHMKCFCETMSVLTGLTLMARSNSSGAIREQDISYDPADKSLTIKLRVFARKGKKKQARSKASFRSTDKRIPAGKPTPEGCTHPRTRYIDLMRKLKTTYAKGGGLPLFKAKSSAAKMSALIVRVLGGKAASKKWSFEAGTTPSSHSLRKTGATMAERAGAPREGRFLRWGDWDDPRALVNYTSGTWEGTGFSRVYFDWLVDYTI